MSRRAAPVPATALYETPVGVVRALVPLLPRVDAVIDLGSGNGRIVDTLRAAGVARRYVACEPDPSRAGSTTPDVELRRRPHAALDPLAGIDLVVSNPPFCEATTWARGLLVPGVAMRTVAFLVRIGWLRAAAHGLPPCDMHLLDPRPSFTSDGRTDGAEYAWCLWGPGRGGRFSVLTWRSVKGRGK